MSELLPFMKMSFPGVLKAKLPCRHKGQESSGSEVMGTNPNSHLRCLIWKQTLTKKWQTRRCDARAKQTKTMCFVLGWVTYWERAGKSSSFVVYLQLFTSIWNQLASRDKTSHILINSNSMVLTTQEEMSSSSKARDQIEVGHRATICQAKWHTTVIQNKTLSDKGKVHFFLQMA